MSHTDTAAGLIADRINDFAGSLLRQSKDSEPFDHLLSLHLLNPKNSIAAARWPETPITAEGSARAKMSTISSLDKWSIPMKLVRKSAAIHLPKHSRRKDVGPAPLSAQQETSGLQLKPSFYEAFKEIIAVESNLRTTMRSHPETHRTFYGCDDNPDGRFIGTHSYQVKHLLHETHLP